MSTASAAYWTLSSALWPTGGVLLGSLEGREQTHRLEEVGVLDSRQDRVRGEALLGRLPVIVKSEVRTVGVEEILVAGEGGSEEFEDVER